MVIVSIGAFLRGWQANLMGNQKLPIDQILDRSANVLCFGGAAQDNGCLLLPVARVGILHCYFDVLRHGRYSLVGLILISHEFANLQHRRPSMPSCSEAGQFMSAFLAHFPSPSDYLPLHVVRV